MLFSAFKNDDCYQMLNILDIFKVLISLNVDDFK